MYFVHPYWLFMLLTPMIVFGVTYRALRQRRIAVAGRLSAVQMAAIAAIVVALAQPVLIHTTLHTTTVVVIDATESISDIDLQRFVDRLHEIQLSSASEDIVVPLVLGLAKRLESLEPSLARSDSSIDSSNLSEALLVAGSRIPHNGLGRVFLLTDGRQTTGDAIRTVAQLAQRGISVIAESADHSTIEGVVLSDISMDPTTAIGETSSLTAHIESSRDTSATLVVTDDRGHTPSMARPIDLHAGPNTITVPILSSHPGVMSWTVKIEGPDVLRGNHPVHKATTFVLPARQVVILTESANDPSIAATQTLLGSSAIVTAYVPSHDDWASVQKRADALILANIPARAIPADIQSSIADAVRSGLPLFVTGGHQSFGAGGYAHTPIEPLLPVGLVQDAQHNDPSTTLVIIIDTSGSMSGARVQLAKEVARLAIARLSPHDKVGIVEFYGSKRWAAPIQPASNVIDIQRALNRLTAEGGTVILPAIEEAFYGLLNARTRTKHILVLTDGGVEEGDFESLARRIAAAGITLSTVQIGPEGDSSFLTQLAYWGHGRSYACSDRTQLPEILVKQPETTLPRPFSETPSSFVVSRRSNLTDSLNLNTLPSMAGHVITRALPTADTLVVSSNGDPLLARWTYGLGRVAAWTSELAGPWTATLVDTHDYHSMMANVLRDLIDNSPRRTLHMNAVRHADAIEINAEYFGNTASTIALIAAITDPTGKQQTLAIDPIAPNRWNARVDATLPGIYRIDATLAGIASTSAATTIQQYDEFSHLAPDAAIISRINALRPAAEAAARVFLKTPTTKEVPLWPVLVIIGIAAFFANLLIRRWPRTHPSTQYASRTLTTAAIVAFLIFSNASASAEISSSPTSHSSDTSTPLQSRYKELLSITTVQPQSASAWAELARIDELLSNDSDAIEHIDRAVTHTTSRDDRFALNIRKALLLYSRNDRAAASVSLNDALSAKSSVESRRFVAVLAALAGDTSTATSHLSTLTQPTFFDNVLRGTLALHQHQFDNARAAFASALPLASTTDDRRFALERILATARHAGQLDALASHWLADPHASIEQQRITLHLLGELNRPDDATRFVQTALTSQATLSADRRRELLRHAADIAIESNRLELAESAWQQLTAETPNDINAWLELARVQVLSDRRSNAERTLRTIVDRTSSGETLLTLAGRIADLNFDDLAKLAITKARTSDGSLATRTIVLNASLQHRRGPTDEATALLRRAADATTDPKSLATLADAFEQLGDTASAITILQRVAANTHAEDVLTRLAWLTESASRHEDAAALWMQLWQTTSLPARRQQAQNRLLETTARLNKLNELATSLTRTLEQSPKDAATLSLLIELYTRINDTSAATAALKRFGPEADSIDALRQLAQLYWNTRQFTLADQTLDALIARDPEHAADTLQQQAMIALELNNSERATTIVARLRALPDRPENIDELAAGVLEGIGRYRDAAEAYQRILDVHPDRVELHLLKARAMKNAGQADQAIESLQWLVETADDDDLFVVAIDGLLNLSASPAALHSAYRRTLTRIAAHPSRLFLYDVADDLMDAMHRPEDQTSLMELAVLTAGERRSAILRQLMDRSAGNGQISDAIAYGQSLLAIDTHLPPQTLIDLGQMLISDGQFLSARAAFAHAETLGDPFAVRQRVIDIYERSGDPTAAQASLRELLIQRPGDIDLLLRSADLDFEMAHSNAAFDRYLDVVMRLVARLPARVGAIDSQPTTQATHIDSASRRTVKADARSLQSAIAGVLASADTDARRAQLIDALSTVFDAEVDSLVRQHRIDATSANNARLSAISNVLRRVAFSLHHRDVASRVDQKLLSLYPRDRSLSQQLATTRREWYPDSPTASTTQPVSLDFVRQQLAEAVLANSSARITQAFESAQALSNADYAQAAPLLWAATIAFSDASTISKQLAHDIDRFSAPSAATSDIETLGRLLTQAWPGLSDNQKRQHLLALIERTRSLPTSAQSIADIAIVRLATPNSLALPGASDSIHRLLNDSSSASDIVASILDSASPEQRIVLLDEAFKARPAAQRRLFLLTLSTSLTSSLDETTLAAIDERFTQAPPIALDDKSAGSVNRLSMLFSQSHPSPLTQRLVERLLEQSPEHPAVLIAAAYTRHASNRTDAAIPLVREAIDVLAEAKAIDFTHTILCRTIARILPSKDRDLLIADLNDRIDMEPRSTILRVLRASLLTAANQRDAAIIDLQAAFRAAPDNIMLSRAMIDAMRNQLRHAELADVLRTALRHATLMQAYQWRTLTDLDLELYRPWAAFDHSLKDATPLAPISRLAAMQQAGRTDRVETLLRQTLIAMTRDDRRYAPFWPDTRDLLGMRSFLTHNEQSYANRQRVYEALADQPFAEKLFAQLIQADDIDAWDVSDLAKGWIRAARHAGHLPTLIDTLETRRSIRTMNTHDVAVLLELARIHADRLPDTLVAALLEHRHTFLTNDDALKTLADALGVRNRKDDARNLARWRLVLALANRSQRDTQETLRHIDTLLAAFPQDERAAMRRRIGTILVAHTTPSLEAALDEHAASLWPGRLDVRDFLPPADSIKDVTAFTANTVAQLSRHRDAGSLNDADLVRQLALLGQWTHTNGLPDATRDILAQATSRRGPMGEHWLWIADLARMADDETLADTIERELLIAKRLPISRTVSLLNRIERTSSPTDADTLALTPATFSDHPEILTRAIRAASAQRDATLVESLSQRLAHISSIPSKNVTTTNPTSSVIVQ